jgi:FMN reductase
MTVNIVGIGGTNRSNSLSYRALEVALEHAEAQGAAVQGFKLYDLNLPLYDPTKPLSDYGENVRLLLEAVRGADGVIFSSASYHATMAGVTKNAIDLLDFLDADERPYLYGRAVGLIAAGGGEYGATTTLVAMMSVVHALRGVVVPLAVPISEPWQSFEDYELTHQPTLRRLHKMTDELVKLATALKTTY